MKLFKDDDMYISRKKWKQIFLAFSIMVLALYLVAMIFSLCGSGYFILNYQNAQMDKIEAWFRDRNIFGLINMAFNVLEFEIVMSFILKKISNPLYALVFYGIEVGLAFIHMPDIVYTLYPFIFYVSIPIIDQFVKSKSFNLKQYGLCLIRMVIATIVTLVLQALILGIKAGYYEGLYHQMNLSAVFSYAIEYDIALSVLLFTIALYIDREKGDNKQWTTDTVLGGSSQTSKTQLPKSSTKNLTKTQKNKIRLFYIKVYCIQLGTFLLVMVLPFLLGKVFEFLVMYLAFCVTRAILGFKYSLHYKKESLCATVGVIVFGILSLVVPFFYVVLIIAVTLGIGLAVLLHLSYKYKGFYLFTKRAKPDKLAELSVIFDDDLSVRHVLSICLHRGLSRNEANIIVDYTSGEKKSYLAHKYNYSEKTIERIINECIDKLKVKD